MCVFGTSANEFSVVSRKSSCVVAELQAELATFYHGTSIFLARTIDKWVIHIWKMNKVSLSLHGKQLTVLIDKMTKLELSNENWKFWKTHSSLWASQYLNTFLMRLLVITNECDFFMLYCYEICQYLKDLHSWTSIVHMTNVWCYKIHSKCRVVQWISQEHSRKEGFFDVVSNSTLYLIFKKPSLAESWCGMKEKYSYLKRLHICVRPKQHGAIFCMQTQNVGAICC